jgi:DNA ligase (NAD+)
MQNIQTLETLYLQAKIEYYEGNPIMTDLEFDTLENKLKELNSKVIEQVGMKRSDFDFPHPTKMLSLSKIQTESINGVTNYQKDLFLKWYNSRLDLIEKKTGNRPNVENLVYSPKFDGNAINIIYEYGKLSRILTRGDGLLGKNVTNKLNNKVPHSIKTCFNIESVEIRCEVVIDIDIFAKINEERIENGLQPFANARNIVAGILGQDSLDNDLVNHLILLPVDFVKNTEHVEGWFTNDVFPNINYFKNMKVNNYENIIKEMEEYRKTSKIQLDGVVISFPREYYSILGVNSHDPESSFALKFVPEEVVTEVTGVEWAVGKTGELTPVVLLKPVELVGTIVKRASGYNAGYILQNNIVPGTITGLIKSGDIIPSLINVINSGEPITLPEFCPDCKTKLTLDNIHLMCTNQSCPGQIAKKLHTAAKAIDMKNVGTEVFKRFSFDFENLYELFIWVFVMSNKQEEFEQFGFKKDSRSLSIFINAFKNIKSLTYGEVILLLAYTNVGLKLADQVAKLYCNNEPDFKGHEKALVEFFKKKDIKEYIEDCVKNLEFYGIKIDKPLKIENMKTNDEIVYVCMTGSPKPNWDTKADFIKEFDNVEEVSLTDKRCKYLITDDYNSTSNKMQTANKKGIQILSYEDFKNLG